MATTEQTNNANQALYDTIDKMCSAVDFLDNFPKSKQSKLIQFSVEFCDNYGVSKDAVDVVLKAKKNEDGKRELFIEVAEHLRVKVQLLTFFVLLYCIKNKKSIITSRWSKI